MRKTAEMLEMEAKHGLPIDKLIIRALNENDGSFTDAAKALDMNVKTLWNWMPRLGIKVKKLAEIA